LSNLSSQKAIAGVVESWHKGLGCADQWVRDWIVHYCILYTNGAGQEECTYLALSNFLLSTNILGTAPGTTLLNLSFLTCVQLPWRFLALVCLLSSFYRF